MSRIGFNSGFFLPLPTYKSATHFVEVWLMSLNAVMVFESLKALSFRLSKNVYVCLIKLKFTMRTIRPNLAYCPIRIFRLSPFTRS